MRMYPEPTGEVRMSLSLRFAAGSHKGMIREGNEDSGYAGPRLLAIADGMGGQAAGEVASSEVISTIVALDDDVPGSDILTSLGTAVQRANDQLRMMVEEDPSSKAWGPPSPRSCGPGSGSASYTSVTPVRICCGTAC